MRQCPRRTRVPADPAASSKASPKRGEWNTLELVVVGPEILTALNGVPGERIAHSAGARQGLIALVVAGPPAGANPSATEVRFKDLRLEIGPAPALSTVKPH